MILIAALFQNIVGQEVHLILLHQLITNILIKHNDFSLSILILLILRDACRPAVEVKSAICEIRLTLKLFVLFHVHAFFGPFEPIVYV